MKFKGVEQFLIESTAKHGSRYDYSKAVYAGAKTKVEIICPEHGSFLQEAYSHVKGLGCAKCAILSNADKKSAKNRSEFVATCRKLHPSLDFSKTIYRNAQTKVTVICPEHGCYDTFPYNLLRGHGCQGCMPGNPMPIKNIIRDCNKVHNNMYCYSKIDPSLRLEDKQIIICPIHGEFTQTMQTHKNGSGCRQCAFDKTLRTGFSLTAWSALQNNRIASVYFVRMFNENESFYKIGITYQGIKRRLRNTPYNVELVNLKGFIDPKIAFRLERRFKRMFKKHKYNPVYQFGGCTECFVDENAALNILHQGMVVISKRKAVA